MEHKETLLRIYERRALIVSKGKTDTKSLSNLLQRYGISVPYSLLESLGCACKFEGQVHPELLIETILQSLNRSRTYNHELSFIRSVFCDSDSILWEDFKRSFSLSLQYKASEIQRILHLFKRFGLTPSQTISKKYCLQFARTCKNFFIKDSQPIFNALHKAILAVTLRKIEKGAQTKTLLDIGKVNELTTQEDESTSNRLLSYRCIENSVNLRNKLFVQAMEKFSLSFDRVIQSVCFDILQRPHKYKNPFIHRGVLISCFKCQRSYTRTLAESFRTWQTLQPVDHWPDMSEHSFNHAYPLLLLMRNLIKKQKYLVFTQLLESSAISKDKSQRIPLMNIENLSSVLNYKTGSLKLEAFEKWRSADTGHLQDYENYNISKFLELKSSIVQVRIATSLKILSGVLQAPFVQRLRKSFNIWKSKPKVRKPWNVQRKVAKKKTFLKSASPTRRQLKQAKKSLNRIRFLHGIEKLCGLNSRKISQKTAFKRWTEGHSKEILDLSFDKNCSYLF